MRIQRNIRKTDCELLMREIRDRGYEFVLPCNLPDRWLKPIVRDLLAAEVEELYEEAEDEASLMSVMIAVSALHQGRNGASPFDEDAMHKWVNRYKKAVIDELLGRQTGVFRSRATIDDIVAYEG